MNKEKVQKYFLVALMAVGGIYGYFDFLLGPLNRREANAKTLISKLEPQVREAHTRIKRTRSIEESDPHAAMASHIFEVMKEKIPVEASVAWLPQRMDAYFSQAGFEKGVFRQQEEGADPDLKHFKRSSWLVDFSKGDFFKLGTALAHLENGEGLLQVTNLKIEAQPTNPELQRISVGFQTIVK